MSHSMHPSAQFVKCRRCGKKHTLESMRFEDAKQEKAHDQPRRETDGVEKEIARQAERFIQPRIHELLQRAAEEPDKKRFVTDQIASYGKTFFRGKEYLLDAALVKIDAAHFNTNEGFEETVVRELTSAIVEFVAISGFSLEEASQYFRSITQEQQNFIPLDKDGVLSYSKFNDKVDLHITKGLTRRALREAISALAQIVQNDEGIKTIVMTSWVVAAHPDLMKKYGFTVNETMDEKEIKEMQTEQADLPAEMRRKPIAEAHITRDKFLERYGSGITPKEAELNKDKH